MSVGTRPPPPQRPRGRQRSPRLRLTLSARFFATLVRFVFSWVDTFWSTSNHLPDRKRARGERPQIHSARSASPQSPHAQPPWWHSALPCRALAAVKAGQPRQTAPDRAAAAGRTRVTAQTAAGLGR